MCREAAARQTGNLAPAVLLVKPGAINLLAASAALLIGVGSTSQNPHPRVAPWFIWTWKVTRREGGRRRDAIKRAITIAAFEGHRAPRLRKPPERRQLKRSTDFDC
jgi:hypothetical protein